RIFDARAFLGGVPAHDVPVAAAVSARAVEADATRGGWRAPQRVKLRIAQSTLAPDSATTFVHRASSLLRSVAIWSVVLGRGIATNDSRRSPNSGARLIFCTSALRRSRSSRGVPAGAARPIQATASKPG